MNTINNADTGYLIHTSGVQDGKSKQQEIKEKLAKEFSVPEYLIHFSNQPKVNVKIIHSEYVGSVHCILHFWVGELSES